MLTCIKTEDRGLAIDTRTENSLSVEEISSGKALSLSYSINLLKK